MFLIDEITLVFIFIDHFLSCFDWISGTTQNVIYWQTSFLDQFDKTERFSIEIIELIRKVFIWKGATCFVALMQTVALLPWFHANRVKVRVVEIVCSQGALFEFRVVLNSHFSNALNKFWILIDVVSNTSAKWMI